MVKRKLPYTEALRILIEKHGLFYPIVRTKFGVVDGRKRLKALVGTGPRVIDKTPLFLDVEIENITQHLKLIKALGTIRLKGKDLERYISEEAKNLSKYGVEVGQIAEVLSNLTGISSRHVRRLLPEEYKDVDKCPHNQKLNEEKRLSSRMKLVAKIRSGYDWLTDEQILKGLKDPMYLLSLADAHYTAIQLSKASIPDLLEVTYTKLEEIEFSKQNEETMLFWKFLAEEYQKRFGSNVAVER